MNANLSATGKVLRRTICTAGVAIALWTCLATAAWGQRVQFNSMVDGGSAASPPLTPVSPPPGFSSSPSTFAPATTQAPVMAAPPGTPPFDPYAPTLTQTPPPFTAPPNPYAAPAATTPYSPYAPSPYAPTPQPLYPEGIQMPQFMTAAPFDIRQPMRFMQEVRGRWTWLSPSGSQQLGVNDVETSATFAIPFFQSNAPLLITPGFGIHFWQGPVTEAPDFAELPGQTYDGYLDGAWHPQITPWFGANLGVRVGAYTDFNTFTTNSIRVMGRGLGIVTLTPTLQIAAGVVYIDRLLVKILPAGGLIWIPNPDTRWEILFPNPKLAHRWTSFGNTEVWYYLTGEYGGGSWTFQSGFNGSNQQFDYNDIRVALGLESYAHNGMHGLFEVGYVFDRQILYRTDRPEYNPSDTLMLRAGLSY